MQAIAYIQYFAHATLGTNMKDWILVSFFRKIEAFHSFRIKN